MVEPTRPLWPDATRTAAGAPEHDAPEHEAVEHLPGELWAAGTLGRRNTGPQEHWLARTLARLDRLGHGEVCSGSSRRARRRRRERVNVPSTARERSWSQAVARRPWSDLTDITSVPAYHPHMTTIISRLIPAIFGAIGLVMIVALWSAEGFGAPPLLFKVFGSLIASVFVLVGVAGVLGLQPKAAAATPSTLSSALGAASSTAARPAAATPTAGTPRSPSQLACTNCGAALGEGADVSPSGDVKCTYCQRWFNVHA